MADQLASKITQWLQDAGLSISTTPNVPDHFSLTVSPPPPSPGPVLTVSKPRENSSFIAVGMGITLHQDHVSKLRDLMRHERVTFLGGLKQDYLKMNVDFMFVPVEAEIPQHIQLVKLIFLDGLTQDHLFDTYTLVRNAGLMTLWRLQDRFGQPSTAIPAIR
ncbi:MAG: DUF2299 domain-containing protein [Candidatus Marsarchaeota archaeon]|nr:DUF2299 domain-containing protein [Candidatus Marsarchaeota archaeon]